MYKFKESIFETKLTEITISNKLFEMFKEWLQDTKLSKQKLKILKILKDGNSVSLNKIQKYTGMSFPLINYHIRGNLRSVGLLKADMVTTKVNRGEVFVTLSTFGEVVLNAIKK